MARDHDWNEHSQTNLTAPIMRAVSTKLPDEEFAEFQKIVINHKTNMAARVRELIRADIEQYGNLE